MARKRKDIVPLFPMGSSNEKSEEKPIEEPQKTEEPQIAVIEQQPDPIPEQPTEKEKDHQPQEQVVPVVDGPKEEPKTTVEGTDRYSKYKKKPKYQTYVPHNVRIPKEMRRDLEKIAKKLGIPLGKNTGFFQEFTIDALQVAIDRAKKELGID